MKLGKGYFAYIVIGLAAVVAVSLVAAINSSDPSGADAMPWIIGSVAAFVIGILALQWRGVYKAAPESGPDRNAGLAGEGTDDAGQINDHNELVARMATEEYDEESLAKGRGGSFGLMRNYMAFTTILVLVCIVLGGLGITGNLPNLGESGLIRFAPFLLAPFVLLLIRLVISNATGHAQDQLAPLGLGVTETPEPGVRPNPFQGSGMQSAVYGATVMAGKRHGRNVEIRMDGRRHSTRVGGSAPEFELQVKGGRPVVKGDAPTEIAAAVQGLASSPHWKKLKAVKGGPSGILAERKVDTQQNWLWDLWLCERLADAKR